MSAPVYQKVTVVKCPCGHPGCSDYWLSGVGKFVQGSGFTKEEAEALASLVNGIRETRHYQTQMDAALEDENLTVRQKTDTYNPRNRALGSLNETIREMIRDKNGVL